MPRVLLYALWIVLPLLQSAIAHRMWIRRLYREYPLFFAYTISHLVRFAILFYSYHLGMRDLYRDAYLSLEMERGAQVRSHLRAFFPCISAVRRDSGTWLNI